MVQVLHVNGSGVASKPDFTHTYIQTLLEPSKLDLHLWHTRRLSRRRTRRRTRRRPLPSARCKVIDPAEPTRRRPRRARRARRYLPACKLIILEHGTMPVCFRMTHTTTRAALAFANFFLVCRVETAFVLERVLFPSGTASLVLFEVFQRLEQS